MRTARIAILTALLLASHTLRSQRATTVNDNSTTPAPPIGALNVWPQNDGGTPTVNVSHYVTYPTLQVVCGTGNDLGVNILTVLSTLAGTDGGIIDARQCIHSTAWLNTITVATSNVTILLPCFNLAMTGSVNVAPGTHNVKVLGCGYMGGTASSGVSGGTTIEYLSNTAPFQIGDSTYATDTDGFEIGNLSIVMTGAGSTARAIDFWRTQDIYAHDLSINGNGGLSTIGLYLDGSGNYTGGNFANLKIENMGQAIWMSGGFYDSIADSYANASTFTRLHIVCPNTSGTPTSGAYGINLLNGDGNTFVGGDVESCDTMLALGAGATSNTFVGVRNEHSNTQISAASGSANNLWLAGGTLYTGQVTDSGTRNTFFDAFHRTENTLNGDQWHSQADATVTDHVDMGIGLGNVRGRLTQYETDVPGTPGSYQYAWQWGPGDGTTGQQVWSLTDQLNSVARFLVEQNTTAGGNDQTALNAAGSGSVCFNCSANSGTGGASIASGGATPSTIWNTDNSGNTYQLGAQSFYSSATQAWRFLCNSTSSCVLLSMTPTANANHLRMFNGAGTELDSEGTYAVTVNNNSASGTGGFIVYGGGASYYATELFGVTASAGVGVYRLTGIQSSSGYSCLQINTSGYLSNTGSACGTGSGSGTVTSVGLSLPGQFSVSGSPVTGSGTLTATWANQAANSFFAGPSSGGSAAPTFRAIAAADLPAATSSAQGAVQMPSGSSGNTLGTAATYAASSFLQTTNTLGCLDGWDHLPCTVFNENNVSESSATGSYSTVWTTTYAGTYRVTGYTYGTTASSSTYAVQQYVQVEESGASVTGAYLVSQATIGTSISTGLSYSNTFVLGAGANVKTETYTSSGSNTGGVWSRAIQIDRVQ